MHVACQLADCWGWEFVARQLPSHQRGLNLNDIVRSWMRSDFSADNMMLKTLIVSVDEIIQLSARRILIASKPVFLFNILNFR